MLSILVHYDEGACGDYLNSTTNITEVFNERFYNSSLTFANQYQPALTAGGLEYQIGNCKNGVDLWCEALEVSESECRLNIRMQAAFWLAACLAIKEIYMVAVNVKVYRKVKINLSTFGDVIFASALNNSLRIRQECMIDSGGGHRERVCHTCHKHCKGTVPSETGGSMGHCQNCPKFNSVDKAADLLHPAITIEYKKSLIANLGVGAITQMILLTIICCGMLAASIYLALNFASNITAEGICTAVTYSASSLGGWGGFNASAIADTIPQDRLTSEQLTFIISNGPQLLFALLYLWLVYNVTFISMEHDWGRLEKHRLRLRCTIVEGDFDQSYFFQLPIKVILPLMAFSSMMHWLLTQALSAIEFVWENPAQHPSHSQYRIIYAVYPVWLATVLMLVVMCLCWWAFTYRRKGFMPQMYGSIRTCCAVTSELNEFSKEGIQWGDGP
ncbi:MAG: hypothetical protein MMC33_003806 [Icmadophila ericetorum]|nr:hypothetical protein [Icmadophila ericetorum]